MTSIARFVVALALTCGSTSAGVAAQPTALQPTEKWVVNFGESQCLASRNYGPPRKPLYLVLKPSPIGQVMQLSVVRKAKWGGGDAAQLPATVRFDEAEPIRSSMLGYTFLKDGVRISLINLPSEKFVAARQAKAISIRSPGELNETFVLAQMGSLMTAIDRCKIELQQDWNIGEINSARLVRRATANLAKLFSDWDYPDIAIRNDQSGSVAFSLLIDDSGKVADCVVTETSGVASLDAQTCAVILERAKFDPAIGLNGKAAKDAVVGSINWRTL